MAKTNTFVVQVNISAHIYINWYGEYGCVICLIIR